MKTESRIRPPEALRKRGITGAIHAFPDDGELVVPGSLIVRYFGAELMQCSALVKRVQRTQPIASELADADPQEQRPRLSGAQRDELATALETVERLMQRG